MNGVECIYRAGMSRCDEDRTEEVLNSEAQRKDELALLHEAFAEKHELAAESLSGDLAEAHRGAADKHEQAACEDRAQAESARKDADAEDD